MVLFDPESVRQPDQVFRFDDPFFQQGRRKTVTDETAAFVTIGKILLKLLSVPGFLFRCESCVQVRFFGTGAAAVLPDLHRPAGAVPFEKQAVGVLV